MEAYPWHAEVLDELAQRLARDALPAAIGLSCAEGWGGQSLLARASMLLLGLDQNQQPEELAHPDFRWTVPDGSMIKVDQVRALNALAVKTPQIAPRKVAAILDAHLLNTNASNTLLKTLEEPPANTHILLCTAHWSRLLPTLRSRCQHFQVTGSITQAENWLREQGVAATPEQLAQAGYAPITMREQFADFDLQPLLAEVALSQHFSELVDRVISLGTELVLASWFRLLIAQQGHAPSRALLAFADELNDARRMLDTTNSTNVRLALERLFHLWQQVVAYQARMRQDS